METSSDSFRAWSHSVPAETFLETSEHGIIHSLHPSETSSETSEYLIIQSLQILRTLKILQIL